MNEHRARVDAARAVRKARELHLLRALGKVRTGDEKSRAFVADVIAHGDACKLEMALLRVYVHALEEHLWPVATLGTEPHALPHQQRAAKLLGAVGKRKGKPRPGSGDEPLPGGPISDGGGR